MNLVCSRCHTQFAPEAGQSPVCPECGAEAGLERLASAGRPTYIFAGLVGVCAALALSSWFISALI